MDNVERLLQALADAQKAPDTAPQPRRVRVYLDCEDRPEIHGRPMSVHRVDAREWITKGLARSEPFVESSAGVLVQPTEYRKPIAPPSGPPAMVFNPNTARYEPVPPGMPVPESAEVAALKAQIAALQVEKAVSQAATKAKPTLQELKAEWAKRNPDKKAPPAAKRAWYEKSLAEHA